MASRIDILSVVQEFSVKSLFDDGVDVDSFQSEYQSYTYFLQEFAANYENDKITKTYLVVRNRDCKIIAYFTIMPGSVTVYRDTRPDEVSPKIDELGTLHIHHLAADRDAVENYKHIVRFILLLIKNLIINKISKYINIAYISLDADINENPDLIGIYESAGFKMLGFKGELPSMICAVYD